jgi:hypothetical protein
MSARSGGVPPLIATWYLSAQLWPPGVEVMCVASTSIRLFCCHTGATSWK